MLASIMLDSMDLCWPAWIETPARRIYPGRRHRMVASVKSRLALLDSIIRDAKGGDGSVWITAVVETAAKPRGRVAAK